MTATATRPLRQRADVGEALFGAALVLLLILSEVFSSNIQSTLPGLSHLARLGLTGGALVLLLAKCVLWTRYDSRAQMALAAAAIGYSGFAAWYGDDVWFLLTVLAGVAAKGVDLRRALRVYLAAAVAGLVVVQLLHYATPLVPFRFYARNWDFGYGHYNGYGARLLGVFFAWGWLRWDRLRWFDWAGLTALAAYTLLGPGCRGAGMAMVLLLLLFAAQRLLPRVFLSRPWQWLTLALYPLLTAGSLLAGYLFDPADPAAPRCWPGSTRCCPAGSRSGTMSTGPSPTPTRRRMAQRPGTTGTCPRWSACWAGCPPTATYTTPSTTPTWP